jgi:hypothetical protein
MLSKLSKNGVYEILAIQKGAITQITGIITPKSINTLENELGGTFTILKSTHFAKGQRYRYLAFVIPEEKYRIIIVDPVWVCTAPVNPGAYAALALAAGVSAAHHEQIITQHKETQTAYTEYLGAQEAG